jgi:hypothetical protein
MCKPLSQSRKITSVKCLERDYSKWTLECTLDDNTSLYIYITQGQALLVVQQYMSSNDDLHEKTLLRVYNCDVHPVIVNLSCVSLASTLSTINVQFPQSLWPVARIPIEVDQVQEYGDYAEFDNPLGIPENTSNKDTAST